MMIRKNSHLGVYFRNGEGCNVGIFFQDYYRVGVFFLVWVVAIWLQDYSRMIFCFLDLKYFHLYQIYLSTPDYLACHVLISPLHITPPPPLLHKPWFNQIIPCWLTYLCLPVVGCSLSIQSEPFISSYLPSNNLCHVGPVPFYNLCICCNDLRSIWLIRWGVYFVLISSVVPNGLCCH